MKVLATVPTLGRLDDAIKVARVLQPFADSTYVIAQGYDINDHNITGRIGEHPFFTREHIDVILRGKDGLYGQHNFAAELAIGQGFDWWLHADDDLAIKPEMIPLMLALASEEPNLGAISSISRVQHFYLSGVTSNKGYKVDPIPNQFWLMNVEALRETRAFDDPPFGVRDPLCDLTLAVKFWSLGFPCVRIQAPIEFSHNQLISQYNKEGVTGGFTTEGQSQRMPAAIEGLQSFCGPDQPLKFLRPKMRKDGQIAYNIRYNHHIMMANVRERGHCFGYLDSKNRRM